MIRKTLQATKEATFALELPDPAPDGPPTPMGTGFFVSNDGWFVTAAHVISEGGKVREGISNAFLRKEHDRESGFTKAMCEGLSLDYIDKRSDIALLSVNFEANKNKDWLKGKSGFPFLEVSSRELDEGEPIYAFGYPLSEQELTNLGNIQVASTWLYPRVTSAIVSSLIFESGPVRSKEDLKRYVLDKALNYGNSGGPIVATETGRVHALCEGFQAVYIRQDHYLINRSSRSQVCTAAL
jgi:serine protease Do